MEIESVVQVNALPPDFTDLMTIVEAARSLGKSRSTVYRMARKRDLLRYSIVGRRLYVSRVDVEAYVSVETQSHNATNRTETAERIVPSEVHVIPTSTTRAPSDDLLSFA